VFFLDHDGLVDLDLVFSNGGRVLVAQVVRGLGDGDVGLVSDEVVVGLGEEDGEERRDVNGEGCEDDGGQELERS
jgi:hypothetical protein